MTEINEGPAFPIPGDLPPLRTFRLTCRGVRAEVCTLGASLTSLLVPSPQGDTDDVVLGYKTPAEMYTSDNPSYLCAVVGRVANRIANGCLKMEKDATAIQLAINNEPNHLHGGYKGFSRKIWDGEIVQHTDGTQAVKFTLMCESGDQGYPGNVLCTATYSLRPRNRNEGVSLFLDLSADLQSDTKTPINLAQHSYFNLSRHDDPRGILDHKLTMPCHFYTPLDANSIPTREVKSLNTDSTMDWRGGRLMRDAITDFALSKAKAKLTDETADKAMADRSLSLRDLDTEPFGFDHNYAVHQSPSDDDGLYVVGILEHEATKRSLRVRTSAPGVQLYTANYLDGKAPSQAESKDSASYLRWQGVCLETQHFPDSVLVDETEFPDFAKGKCVILDPSNRSYRHTVAYDISFATARKESTVATYRGNDSEGTTSYESVDAMWRSEGVCESNKTGWYDRASQYYEENCPETVDGVLGGFANISDLDLAGSRDFIKELEQLRGSDWRWSVGAACECGAGIGRVSKGLLLPLQVKRCDLVESSSRLLFAAPDYIGLEAGRCRFYCQGLQDWTPSKQTYSIIWVQWVFCYLTDNDAITFLQRCGEALVDGGVVCLKENTCQDTDFVLDKNDASVTRSVPYLLHLAERAGLRVVLQRHQNNFPEEIFPVPMIALEPASRVHE